MNLHDLTFTSEELGMCKGMCSQMHPYPMILQRKKIPADILAKIGQPTQKEKKKVYP